MSKRKLSETENCPPKKLRKLNSGSFGDVFSDGSIAYKISRYNLKTSDGIDPQILNEIIYLKKLRGQEFLLSLNSVESNINNLMVNMKILIPLAVCDLEAYIQGHTIPERGANWDLLTSNMLNALDYLHQNKVCHLDIKPGNILYFGQCFKLNDFNLSITTKNLRKGVEHPAMTCLYRSPEVIIHNKHHQDFGDWEITIKSDMWSLGCTLYEFMVGTPLFDVKYGRQLLKMVYFRLTETMASRNPYTKYIFLKDLDKKIYTSVPLISLKSYLEEGSVNNSNQWHQLVCSMVNVQQDLRPDPRSILRKMNWGIRSPEEQLDNWEKFDYVEEFSSKIGDQSQFGLLDRVKFMTGLKYNYKNAYARWQLWKFFWLEYKKLNLRLDTPSENELFLEIFEVFNRYLDQLAIVNFRSSSGFLSFFKVVMRLVYKIRKAEISNHIICLPREEANRLELDIIRLLNYDFSLNPVGSAGDRVDGIDDGDLDDFKCPDFDQFFEI